MELTEWFNPRSQKGSMYMIIVGIILIAISGLVFAGTYFVMDTVQTALLSTSCEISGNVFFDDCQDMWTMAIYPFLNFKYVLVYLSFFSIFILTMGMLLMGYQSGTKPSMMGVLVLVEIALTYGAIHISNIYRTLLDSEIIRTAMINFSVYNKVMLYFPWFVFVISLFSLVLGIINWQRSPVNKVTEELDY